MPQVAYSCPHCGSHKTPVKLGTPKLATAPMVAIPGLNQYEERSMTQTQMALPQHAGMTPDSILCSREAAKNGLLQDLYDADVARFNVSPEAGTYTYCWGAGNPEVAKIVGIGEAPGAVEDKFGAPFLGPAGQCLSGVLHSVGISRASDVLLINTTNSAPPPDAPNVKGIGKPRAKAMLAERPRVLEVLHRLARREQGLKAIVCLGKYAYVQLAKRTELEMCASAGKEYNVDGVLISRLLGWHKSQMIAPDLPDVPVLIAYHPSYVLRVAKNGEPMERERVLREYKQTFQKLREVIGD